MNSLSQAVWQNKKQHVVLVVRAVSSEEKRVLGSNQGRAFSQRFTFVNEINLLRPKLLHDMHF